MAVYVFPEAKEKMLKWFCGIAATQPTGTMTVAFMASTYTPDPADEFFDDVSAEVVDTEAVASVTANSGIFDCANDTLTALSGDEGNGLLFYMDSGTPGTSALLAFLDGYTGLPYTPSGVDLILTFPAEGIFQL